MSMKHRARFSRPYGTNIFTSCLPAWACPQGQPPVSEPKIISPEGLQGWWLWARAHVWLMFSIAPSGLIIYRAFAPAAAPLATVPSPLWGEKGDVSKMCQNRGSILPARRVFRCVLFARRLKRLLFGVAKHVQSSGLLHTCLAAYLPAGRQVGGHIHSVRRLRIHTATKILSPLNDGFPRALSRGVTHR